MNYTDTDLFYGYATISNQLYSRPNDEAAGARKVGWGNQPSPEEAVNGHGSSHITIILVIRQRGGGDDSSGSVER
jgi:hypothetical protein